jgi:hypothetical protein
VKKKKEEEEEEGSYSIKEKGKYLLSKNTRIAESLDI